MSTKTQELPEVGEIVVGTISKIDDHGAYAILDEYDGIQGFLHISEIAHERVNKVEDYLKEGEEIEVKVLGIDRGRIKLSRKVLIDK